ncbi:hypothetical protein C8Q79DRAFT_1012497 [Trametes meyenii]|nr:hypothetical protein C8Q79DRAFT_1012497 [Trametes meyenii]
MSAENNQIVSIKAALTELLEQRNDIDLLQVKSSIEVRNILRPVGFSRDSKDWEDNAHQILTDLNNEYRHQAKAQILENSRKIRSKKGFRALVRELFEVAEMYNTATERFTEFQALWESEKMNLRPYEHFEYDDVIETLGSSISIYGLELVVSRQRLNASKNAEVATLIQLLNQAASQTQNAIALWCLLSRLTELQEERLVIEQRSGALFAVVSGVLMMEKTLTRDVVDGHLAKYTAIREPIRELLAKETHVLSALKNFLASAPSSPQTLGRGIQMSDNDLSVADLCEGYKVFIEIHQSIDLMHELYDTLIPTLERSTAQLKARLQLGITVVNLT